MALIQVEQHTSGSWQKTIRIPYSTIVGGYTDIIVAPDGAQGYSFQYKITNVGAGTILMQKSSGTTPDMVSGAALFSPLGSAVAANVIGDQTGQFLPTGFRFQIAGAPNASDVITIECSFK